MVKKKLKIIWDIKAIESLKDIISYIKLDSPANAEKVKKEIITAVKKLNDFPEKFSKEHYLKETTFNYRFKAVYSYKIIYRIAKTEIRIPDIFHTSRSPIETSK